MTDSELTRMAAEKVMGWQAFPLDRDGYSEAPKPKLIQQITGFHPEEWAVFREDGRYDKWDPLTDWRAAGEIAEKMRADGWELKLHITVGSGTNARFLFSHYPKKKGRASTAETSVFRAITIAALLAIGAITDDQL
jgi:hypothetical protein